MDRTPYYVHRSVVCFGVKKSCVAQGIRVRPCRLKYSTDCLVIPRLYAQLSNFAYINGL